MTSLALGLVLAAAFFHAGWNLLAKRVAGGDAAAFTWLVAALAALLYAPLAAAVVVFQRPHLDALVPIFLLGASVLHIGYYLLLQRGYRSGDLSLVYPIARGTGPLLATGAAIAFFGERPSPMALAGAALITLGVFTLLRPAPGAEPSERGSAIGYALLTGVVIASYTLWDKHAVSALAIPPLLFDWGSHVGRTLLLAPVALGRWPEVRREWQTHRPEALGVAILSPLAYILVLTALASSPVSYVAPAREISILIGAALGARLLAEGDARRRLAAAGAMILGLAALALG